MFFLVFDIILAFDGIVKQASEIIAKQVIIYIRGNMSRKNIKLEKNRDYEKIIKRHAPKSPVLKNSFMAFIVGGVICFVGEWLAYLYRYLGVSEENSYVLVTVTLIFLASVSTALGFFDKIARFGGAGTLVPVTGFSNAVTSSAIDNRSEGYVSGVGAKIFTVAGPVILYSTIAGTVYGLIYYIYKMVVLL